MGFCIAMSSALSSCLLAEATSSLARLRSTHARGVTPLAVGMPGRQSRSPSSPSQCERRYLLHTATSVATLLPCLLSHLSGAARGAEGATSADAANARRAGSLFACLATLAIAAAFQVAVADAVAANPLFFSARNATPDCEEG